MAGETAILLKGLVKHYGRVTAVNGLDLAVAAGTIYGLLGPDGAGKTTAIRCLSGGIQPDGGLAQVFGLDVRTSMDRIRPMIGYMPQRFALYQDLTMIENLTFFCDLYGVGERERSDRLRHLLAFTRLAGHEGKRAGQLSGGMKQKLVLCAALAHNPQVLLLDEPSTGVDPVSRRDFWRILLDLKGRGVAILVTTPYMDEAGKCDVVGMAMGGRVLIEGNPGDLVRRFPMRILEVSASPLLPARRILGGIPGVHTAVLHAGAVHLVVTDIDGVRRRIGPALERDGIRVGGVKEIPPGLEDVFVHEIQSRRQGSDDARRTR